MNDIVKAIMKKYTKQNKDGYIFPFKMNSLGYNRYNHLPKGEGGFIDWDNAKKYQLRDINKFLHLLEKPLGIEGNFTLYIIRHTAISHLIWYSNLDLKTIASMAGNSLEMLSKHYAHEIELKSTDDIWNFNHIKQ